MAEKTIYPLIKWLNNFSVVWRKIVSDTITVFSQVKWPFFHRLPSRLGTFKALCHKPPDHKSKRQPPKYDTITLGRIIAKRFTMLHAQSGGKLLKSRELWFFINGKSIRDNLLVSNGKVQWSLCYCDFENELQKLARRRKSLDEVNYWFWIKKALGSWAH